MPYVPEPRVPYQKPSPAVKIGHQLLFFISDIFSHSLTYKIPSFCRSWFFQEPLVKVWANVLLQFLKNPSTLFGLSTCLLSLSKADNITSIQKNTHPINLMSEVFGVLVYTLMGVLVMGVFSIWAKTKKLSHRPQWHLKVHYLLMIPCSHRSCGALFIHFISAFFLRS